MPIRRGPSGVLADLGSGDLTPGLPGQIIRTGSSGSTEWLGFPAPWGTGRDGDIVMANPAGTPLDREMHYDHVTFAGAGWVLMNGFPLRCRSLDFRGTTAPYALFAGANDGDDGAAGGGGGGGGRISTFLGYTVFDWGLDGADGGDTGFAGNDVAVPYAFGGTTTAVIAASGAGGRSAANAGGLPLGPPDLNFRPLGYYTDVLQAYAAFGLPPTPIGGGQGGAGGAGSAGAAGGGGGAGGAIAVVYAETLIVDPLSPGIPIFSPGGRGGRGETGPAGGADGGGGGSGGCGGFIYVVYGSVQGSIATFASAPGGTGGTGGNGFSIAEDGGQGGGGGGGGHILLIDWFTGAIVESEGLDGTAGVDPGRSQLGGAGAPGQPCQLPL